MNRFSKNSLKNKFELFLFLIFLISINEVSARLNLNSNRKELTRSENRNDTKEEYRKVFPEKNYTVDEEKTSNDLNLSIEEYNEKSLMKNFSILISIIWIVCGFIISTLFFLFALLFNKKNMVDINTSSIQIVGSLKEIMREKIPYDESVILNF